MLRRREGITNRIIKLASQGAEGSDLIEPSGLSADRYEVNIMSCNTRRCQGTAARANVISIINSCCSEMDGM